ncbi:MAG: tRNA (cytidine(34)-2'-O)-methyltransferase [Bifidobacteriaceae bacterium]|nr:tRNA (cytidine(34)-2'-O)-methyltransferase [Bifidobacteriaceae bacterium]
MFHLVFYQPCIPTNTGNAIRLAAVTGVRLHLVEPLGFELTDTKLRRSGLDYHDLADLTVHPDLASVLDAVSPAARIYAFTTHGTTGYTAVSYRPGDVLLFGPEPHGLPDSVKRHPAVTELVRIPMLPARRSLNLANSAAIAVYEAWRQQGFGQAAAQEGIA